MTNSEVLSTSPLIGNPLRLTADIWPRYLTSPVADLASDGIDLNSIWPGDCGLRLHRDTLFPSARSPTSSLVSCARHWAAGYGRCRTRAPLRSCPSHYDASLDRDAQVRQMVATPPSVHTGEDVLCWMQKQGRERMAHLLADREVIPSTPDIASLATDQFLVAIYGAGR